MNKRIERLKGARQEKMDWRRIASVIKNEVDSLLSKRPGAVETTVYKEASELSGYSVNQLRRYVQNYDFLEFVKNKYSAKAYEALSDLPENSISIVRRIIAVDPDISPKAFTDLVSNKPTYNSLREQYRNVTQRGNRALDVRNNGLVLEHKVRSFIEAHRTKLLGSEYIDVTERQVKQGRFMPRPDLIFYDSSSEKNAVFEVKIFHRTASVNTLLRGAAYESSFYDQYWLAVACPKQFQVDIAEGIEFANLKNVGLLWIDQKQKDEITIIRKPTGEPEPDRRQILKNQYN